MLVLEDIFFFEKAYLIQKLFNIYYFNVKTMIMSNHLKSRSMFSAPTLLEESEALHKAALALSMMAFGEKNVQTAKHYGNLGRLYQSMQKFQVRIYSYKIF